MGLVFTQWETDITVYRADASGNAVGAPVWVGGTASKLRAGVGFNEEEANRPGESGINFQQLEERNEIELENVWLARPELEGADWRARSAVPHVRNARYVVVLIWMDAESGFWLKRIYYNVQFGVQSFGSETQFFEQKLPMRAGYYVDISGLISDGIPDETAKCYGRVRYVSDTESSDIYLYDFDTRAFTELMDPTGRAQIVPADSDYDLSFLVDGEVVATMLDGSLHVGALAVGVACPSRTGGRMEFLIGERRVASLDSGGILWCPAVEETASDPVLTGDFRFEKMSLWLLSITASGLRVPSITGT